MARRILGRRVCAVAAAIAAGALLLSSCASADGESSTTGGDMAATQSGLVNVQGEAGDPVDGGTLTFGEYSFPSSLDTARTQVSGYTGGTPMAAIFDVLVRYDADTGTFEPQLAETLDSDDGGTLDADAVRWSIDRYLANRGASTQVWMKSVASTEVVDPRTVRFTLVDPWLQFPSILTQGLGMVVAKSSDAGEGFTPIGAGPYTLDRFAPNEEIA